MLIEVIGMPWGSMPCGGFQEAKNRPCLGYQPETEGAKPRTPLFKISNNLLILGEELSEVREIEKPGNLGQTGFPRVLRIAEGTAATPAMAAERDRVFGLIRDIVSDEPAIYEPQKRTILLHDQAQKTGTGINKLYSYLGKYWRGGMSPSALLPRYDKRGAKAPVFTRRPGRPKIEGENGKIR